MRATVSLCKSRLLKTATKQMNYYFMHSLSLSQSDLCERKRKTFSSMCFDLRLKWKNAFDAWGVSSSRRFIWDRSEIVDCITACAAAAAVASLCGNSEMHATDHFWPRTRGLQTRVAKCKSNHWISKWKYSSLLNITRVRNCPDTTMLNSLLFFFFFLFFVFLSFCLYIILIKCLKGLKSLFVSQF